MEILNISLTNALLLFSLRLELIVYVICATPVIRMIPLILRVVSSVNIRVIIVVARLLLILIPVLLVLRFSTVWRHSCIIVAVSLIVVLVVLSLMLLILLSGCRHLLMENFLIMVTVIERRLIVGIGVYDRCGRILIRGVPVVFMMMVMMVLVVTERVPKRRIRIILYWLVVILVASLLFARHSVYWYFLMYHCDFLLDHDFIIVVKDFILTFLPVSPLHTTTYHTTHYEYEYQQD